MLVKSKEKSKQLGIPFKGPVGCFLELEASLFNQNVVKYQVFALIRPYRLVLAQRLKFQNIRNTAISNYKSVAKTVNFLINLHQSIIQTLFRCYPNLYN